MTSTTARARSSSRTSPPVEADSRAATRTRDAPESSSSNTSWSRWVAAALIAGTCLFVFLQLRPGLIFANTTPAGGDLGAHVWGPSFLKGRLWDHGLLSGWSSDWFGGFPAYRFYMPVPALGAVLLDGVLPYGVALKVMVVLPLLGLPAIAALWARRASSVETTPIIVAAATLLFLFDDSYYKYGGNIASTVVGEYGNALALVVGLAALAVFERDLSRERRGPAAGLLGALAALCHPIGAIFATIALVSSAATRAGLTRTRNPLVHVARSLLLAALLSAFWYVPLIAYRSYFNDLGFTRVDSYGTLLFPLPAALELLVAASCLYAVVDAVRFRRSTVLSLASTTMVFALLVLIAPRGVLWNARLAPPWHLCRIVLAGVGAGAVLDALARRSLVHAQRVRRLGAAAVLMIVIVGISWDTGTLPGGSKDSATVGDGLESVTAYRWIAGPSHAPNRVRNFATFAFGGYERGPNWGEYESLIATFRSLSATEGCGRAVGEFDPDGAFGSTYTVALLPWWTDGCIASVEGLYADSSPTSSFAFIAESALSEVFSAYEPGLPYEPFDLQRGARYLQELGAKYYVAHSQSVRDAARSTPGLRSLASSEMWEIFEVDGVSLVEPLRDLPVVATGVGSREAWQDLAVAWFTRADPDFVRVTAGGPQDWPRYGRLPSSAPGHLDSVTVSDVVDSGDEIRFHVDKTGVPVLVRASYFPTWHADGADGPWRTAPNWMIVIPTSNDVRLTVGTGGVESFASYVTIAGLVLVVVLALVPPVRRLRLRLAADESSAEPSPAVSDERSVAASTRTHRRGSRRSR